MEWQIKEEECDFCGEWRKRLVCLTKEDKYAIYTRLACLKCWKELKEKDRQEVKENV